MHRSDIFLLRDDGRIQPVPTPVYVDWVRDNVLIPECAGQRVRAVDLYVSMQDDHLHSIENETYSFFGCDASGRVGPHDGKFSREENRRF